MKLQDILTDPSAAYGSPDDVLKDNDLTPAEKLKVLDQWEFDARELQVATEENMPGPEDCYLEDILKAKDKLLKG
ncbi:hypothetical protein [Pseudidiomarina salinarum]|uniref:hypothetical protein n=1 Tax=Pseudidiomarina salinarum TaxID=435908 RepID=UPI0005505CCA|nr:hypothetical protein [Pseudidiomarina salinarum]RUO70078.1 hypothetical protein CWI79_01015 [Pseudidiomarina salinarum]